MIHHRGKQGNTDSDIQFLDDVLQQSSNDTRLCLDELVHVPLGNRFRSKQVEWITPGSQPASLDEQDYEPSRWMVRDLNYLDPSASDQSSCWLKQKVPDTDALRVK